MLILIIGSIYLKYFSVPCGSASKVFTSPTVLQDNSNKLLKKFRHKLSGFGNN